MYLTTFVYIVLGLSGLMGSAIAWEDLKPLTKAQDQSGDHLEI